MCRIITAYIRLGSTQPGASSVAASVDRPKQGRQGEPERGVQVRQPIQQGKAVPYLWIVPRKLCQVSEAEVADVFRILDTNVDGYLTVNELSKLPEKVTKLVGIQPMSHTHAKL